MNMTLSCSGKKAGFPFLFLMLTHSFGLSFVCADSPGVSYILARVVKIHFSDDDVLGPQHSKLKWVFWSALLSKKTFACLRLVPVTMNGGPGCWSLLLLLHNIQIGTSTEMLFSPFLYWTVEPIESYRFYRLRRASAFRQKLKLRFLIPLVPFRCFCSELRKRAFKARPKTFGKYSRLKWKSQRN